MSFLKQLLNPFVEFEDDKKPAPPPGTTSTIPVSPQTNEVVHHPLIPSDEGLAVTPHQTHQPASPLLPAGTELATEHQHYFDALIDKANKENPLFAGPDFKEFVDAKLDIDDITDENLKYTTAFNILKSSGLTKEKLLSSGREYMNIIGRDLNAFQGAHAQLYKKELQQKEVDLQSKVEELQQLSQRLSTLKSEINQISQEINIKKDTLNKTKNSFLLAGEQKQQEIQTELQKIASYFK
jgi:hypothetical protein